jgi:hypothetical protein
MATVILKGARLSNNPETKTIANEQGVNGLVNVTSNGKQFYQTDVTLLNGLTPVNKTHTVWADDNGKFPVSVAEYNEMYKGEKTQGKLVRFDEIPTYEVEGKEFNHVTLLVMEGESESAVIAGWIKRNERAETPVNSMKVEVDM